MTRRRYLLLQEKTLKTYLLKARETLFNPEAVEVAHGCCDIIYDVIFTRKRSTAEFWYKFGELVDMALVNYETSSLPESFLSSCMVRFFSEVPGVIEFTLCSPKGALLYCENFFIDDLLLGIQRRQAFMDLSGELQLSLPILVGLLNSLFCTESSTEGSL